MMRVAATGLCLLLGLAPAEALDCGKARTPLETAICADPAARGSDEAMIAAFERVRAGVGADQRQAILDDQRVWLKERNRDCSTGDSAVAPAACATASNRKRVAALLAEPESGPGLDPRPLPVFVRQAGGRSQVEVGLRLYRFAAPRSAGERLLNAEAAKAIAGAEYKKEEPDDRDWTNDVDWALAYAAPGFVSIRVAAYGYSGGAHGYGSVGGLNIDLRQGRILTFDALFEARARAEIVGLCLAQVQAEKRERGADGEDDAKDLRERVEDVVKALDNWWFSDSAATITFNQYTIGSYAEGPYECELALKQLAPLAREPLPLR